MKTFGDHLDQNRWYEQEIAQFTYLTRDTHQVRELGSVDGNTLYLFEAKSPNGILITSGWQGDEPAGWEAAKTLAKTMKNVSFMPYASPTCFRSRQHRVDQGNVGRGWPEVKTPEGQIINNNIDRIVNLSKEAFISLEEDPKRFICYFYSWNTSPDLEELIEIKMKSHFPLTEGAKHTAPEGIFSGYVVAQGAKQAIQLETPADGSYTISKRVDCLVAITPAIVKLLTL